MVKTLDKNKANKLNMLKLTNPLIAVLFFGAYIHQLR